MQRLLNKNNITTQF